MSLIIITLGLCLYSLDASAGPCTPTQNDVEGPYYLPGAPFRTAISGPDEPGELLTIRGSVRGSDCTTTLSGALIEVWQTDASGKYYYREEDFRLRGQLRAGKNGEYKFSTVKPGRYKVGHGYRPAHIHIKVSLSGYRTLVTQIYFRDDPYLWPNDSCGPGCRSDDQGRIISLENTEGKGLVGEFGVVLGKTASPNDK